MENFEIYLFPYLKSAKNNISLSESLKNPNGGGLKHELECIIDIFESFLFDRKVFEKKNLD